MYRPFTITIAVLLLWAGRLFGQTPIPLDTVTLPIAAAAVEQSAPSVADCVVRVVAGVGPGTWSAGSGTNVRKDGLVLTNEHVVGSKIGRKITLHFRSGKEYVGEVVAADRQDDVAAVAFKPDEDTPYTAVADKLPIQGDKVWTIGYPRGKFALRYGDVLGYYHRNTGAMDWLSVNTWIASGDSGGGVFDADGSLVAVQGHSFGGSDRCLACDLRPIRRILGRCPGGKCPASGPGKPSPTPGEVPPPPPPNTGPVAQDLSAVVKRIDDMAAKIDAMKPVPGSPGPAGPKGEPGPAGSPGATIDQSRPLTCELYDVDGTLIQRVEFWHGQPLKIRLKPVPVAAPPTK